MVHQLFLREGQRTDERSCLLLSLRVDQEDDAFAVVARIPLSDFPVEIELHSCPNVFRDYGHHLLRTYALLGSQNHQHCGIFRYSYGWARLNWP
jgi:hypothetical protein